MKSQTESLDVRETRAVLKLKQLPPGERAKALSVIKRLYEIKIKRRTERGGSRKKRAAGE